MWVDLDLLDVTLDPRDGRAVVWLSHGPTQRCFPLWVDDRDALSMARASDATDDAGSSREPDPFRELAGVVGAAVESVQLLRIHGGVLHAALVVRWDGRVLHLAARPSEAIRIAMAARVPVRILEDLLDRVAARIREAEARLPEDTAGVGAASVSQTHAERWNALLAHFSFESGRSPYEA